MKNKLGPLYIMYILVCHDGTNDCSSTRVMQQKAVYFQVEPDLRLQRLRGTLHVSLVQHCTTPHALIHKYKAPYIGVLKCKLQTNYKNYSHILLLNLIMYKILLGHKSLLV